jgi:hypothetical protein
MASASYTVLPRVVVLLLLQVLLADFPTQLQVIRACVKKISISILPPLPSFFFLQDLSMSYFWNLFPSELLLSLAFNQLQNTNGKMLLGK